MWWECNWKGDRAGNSGKVWDVGSGRGSAGGDAEGGSVLGEADSVGKGSCGVVCGVDCSSASGGGGNKAGGVIGEVCEVCGDDNSSSSSGGGGTEVGDVKGDTDVERDINNGDVRDDKCSDESWKVCKVDCCVCGAPDCGRNIGGGNSGVAGGVSNIFGVILMLVPAEVKMIMMVLMMELMVKIIHDFSISVLYALNVNGKLNYCVGYKWYNINMDAL